MNRVVELPLWLLLLIVGFSVFSALERVLVPSVRWFFRRRMQRAVTRMNTKLSRPIEPFKLARRHDMIQRLIYDPKVAEAIAEHAKSEAVPENVPLKPRAVMRVKLCHLLVRRFISALLCGFRAGYRAPCIVCGWGILTRPRLRRLILKPL